MAHKARLTTVLTLLVTFLAAGLLPAAGSWSCPDGTACVYTAGRGFHCLGDRCRMACCAAGRPAHDCSRCGHVVRPDIAVPGRQRTAGAPARCRYREAWSGAIAWLPTRSAPNLRLHAIAVLPAPVAAPVVSASWHRFAPIRGSPPSSSPTPPRSPRAPPAPHCA